MGFLDKAKERASQLAEQAKEIGDVKEKHKVDDLLDDLGRIVYRQRTERTQIACAAHARGRGLGHPGGAADEQQPPPPPPPAPPPAAPQSPPPPAPRTVIP